MEKLITIFSFTKLFYEAYQQNLPLDNFPMELQELINIDITQLVKSNEVKANEKAGLWKEEAFRSIEELVK